jgi:hypothetical protein
MPLAKHFNRPLASFALVPSPQAHPLTSNVMVVNKDGDLELYAVHDAPKQAIWSSRGDLSIGIGTSFTFLSGFARELEPPVEPWSIPRSDSITRDESSVRDRKRMSVAPTFGKSTEDGFPSLNETIVKLKAPARAYSPASPRMHQRVSLQGGQPVYVDHGDPEPETNGETSKRRKRRSRQRDSSGSRGRKQNMKTINGIVEEDISMVMRNRAVRGYGLNNVGHMQIVKA